MKTRTKSKKVNKAWLHDHVNDPYVKLAQREGYRARAAYKLKQIDEELGLIKPGQLVVDLGAAPGAWSQYVRRRFAPEGGGRRRRGGGPARRHASSRWTCSISSRSRACTFIQGDFREDAGAGRSSKRRSAAGGSTWCCRTWRRTCRASRAPMRRASSTWSNWRSISALAHLKPDGALVGKVFHGSGYSAAGASFSRTAFKIVKPIKPKASRDKSAETFLVGMVPKGRGRRNSASDAAPAGQRATNDYPTASGCIQTGLQG